MPLSSASAKGSVTWRAIDRHYYGDAFDFARASLSPEKMYCTTASLRRKPRAHLGTFREPPFRSKQCTCAATMSQPDSMSTNTYLSVYRVLLWIRTSTRGIVKNAFVHHYYSTVYDPTTSAKVRRQTNGLQNVPTALSLNLRVFMTLQNIHQCARLFSAYVAGKNAVQRGS